MVKWYQVFQSNKNNSLTVAWFQVIRILSIWSDSSIWPLDGILIGTTATLGQSVPGSNDNEEVLYTLQSSRTV